MTLQPGLQLQYTYYPISHKVKVTRQWNLVNWLNVTTETFFFKNYTENEARKLVPDVSLFFKKA